LNRVLTWRRAERYGSDAAAQRIASVAAKEMMAYLPAAFIRIFPPNCVTPKVVEMEPCPGALVRRRPTTVVYSS
jgi:hypothetical protein